MGVLTQHATYCDPTEELLLSDIQRKESTLRPPNVERRGQAVTGSSAELGAKGIRREGFSCNRIELLLDLTFLYFTTPLLYPTTSTCPHTLTLVTSHALSCESYLSTICTDQNPAHLPHPHNTKSHTGPIHLRQVD